MLITKDWNSPKTHQKVEGCEESAGRGTFPGRWKTSTTGRINNIACEALPAAIVVGDILSTARSFFSLLNRSATTRQMVGGPIGIAGKLR
jgi:hypothetical protein